MKFKAAIFDTRSIQSYIFAGNQLKTNIGASYLVERIFEDILLPVARKVLGEGQLDEKTWQECEKPDWEKQETAARVGYIGGGNALLLFRPDTAWEDVRGIVSEFTKKLLTACPGLKTGAALGEIDLDKDGRFLQEDLSLTALVHKLKENQNTVFPRVNPAYTGLTLSCDTNDEAADFWDEAGGRFISHEAAAKLLAGSRHRNEAAPAERELWQKLQSVLPAEEREDFLRGFAFPAEFDALGQRETEDYFAIVHIDGNNMGQKFSACDTLTKRKNLSMKIRQMTIEAFVSLLQTMAEEYEGYRKFLSLGHDEEGRLFLPIRPLVLGGDDMTFVCPAKVALIYAKRVMLSLKKAGIDSCGGIAMLKTAYPFFRGYELAEELCGAAKARMRQESQDSQQGSCWLDFALLHGEQAPTLAEIRKQEYGAVLGNMHFGPYRVDEGGKAFALDNLLLAVEALQGQEACLPSSKMKELRSVLAKDAAVQRQFLAQLEHLRRSGSNLSLPQVPSWQVYEENLWHKGCTPYVDAIEMADLIVARIDMEV